ncbi:TPA: hypothetical protein N0H01_006200 [Pseudomonas aeruginosa]|nr:hypothetical protein [Pseudomonas aeruginosa]HCK4703094.1 hypothetical protein [Pseudomonas aeruginosa]
MNARRNEHEGQAPIGSLLGSIAREAGGLTDAEAESFDQLRDKTPAEPISFDDAPRPLTPAEIEALRQDMGQAIEWARAELVRRRKR